jgi:hypothetical protein
MLYQPPPGRDEHGNRIGIEGSGDPSIALEWDMQYDQKGRIMYVNKISGKLQQHPPDLRTELPKVDIFVDCVST